MRFHAYRGVFLFLVLPYALFVVLFRWSGSLETAKDVLVVPVVYALWVIYTLGKAIRQKHGILLPRGSWEETIVLFLSLAPWVGLPLIAYFDVCQWIEVSVTNGGFLLLFALHVRQTTKAIRTEHERLMESEKKLQGWNEALHAEVERRTKEQERLSREDRFFRNCGYYRLIAMEKTNKF